MSEKKIEASEVFTCDPYQGIALPEPPNGYRIAKWEEVADQAIHWIGTKWSQWGHLAKHAYSIPESSIFAVPLDQPMGYVTRVTQLTIAPEGDEVFSQGATTITIEDEGGGEFVIVSQPGRDKGIDIMPVEWPAIRDAIGRMIQETRKGGE